MHDIHMTILVGVGASRLQACWSWIWTSLSSMNMLSLTSLLLNLYESVNCLLLNLYESVNCVLHSCWTCIMVWFGELFVVGNVWFELAAELWIAVSCFWIVVELWICCYQFYWCKLLSICCCKHAKTCHIVVQQELGGYPAGGGYGGTLYPPAGMGAGGGGGEEVRVRVWGCQTRTRTRRVPSGVVPNLCIMMHTAFICIILASK